MNEHTDTTSKELDQDAQTAAQLGPPPSAAPDGAVAFRTPRWIWAWLVPAAALLLLYMARRILAPFVIALIIAYIFSIVVDNLQDRLRLPRWIIVSVLYVIALGVIGAGLFIGGEALYRQTADLIRSGPNVVETALKQVMGDTSYNFGGQTFTAQSLAQRVNEGLSDYFGTAGGTAVGVVRGIVGRLLDTLLVIIVSFYLLLSSRQLGAYFLKFVPAASRSRTGYVAGRINTVLTAYLRGQLLLILIMSVASFIVLQFIFQVKNALPLAILTGFLEILPLLGPAIAAVLAAGAALISQGPGAALGVIIAYTILRELEDQLVMPMIVGRAVELHPVVTIFAVLAGEAIAGPLGMLLAVPAAAAIKVILDFLYPSDPDQALAQAKPGLRVAAREAAARGEEPDPAPAQAKP